MFDSRNPNSQEGLMNSKLVMVKPIKFGSSENIEAKPKPKIS